MQNYKEHFKGKKITIMGLGLLGRGLGYTKFLAECGADLIVTDLKIQKQLSTSLKELKKYKNIKFVLGKHNLEDFKDRDMIIKAAGVPLDSIYIKEAKKNEIPIEMDVSLFAKLAKRVTIIGITGTRGKSMTTTLIYEILSKSKKYKDRVHIGGNLRGIATLPLLKKVKKGDILVCELDSWQLQGFGDSEISPHISVFTSFMQDHMNYYKDSMVKYFNDKANIYKYQKKGDILVIRPDMRRYIPQSLIGELIVINRDDVEKYDFSVPGEHNRENLACAVAVAEKLKVSKADIAKAINGFKGLEGRMQYLKSVNGIKIYNDNNATTPEATIAGINALSKSTYKIKPKIILISGGNDKKLSLYDLVKTINRLTKSTILIPGSGTDILSNFKIYRDNKLSSSKKIYKTKNLKEAVQKALEISEPGDTILFSPAFSSFSQYNNEYERGDEFLKIIKDLK
jgi:UDP-N-acetylmuramoylalanine--D-glutamate ligase